MNKFKIKDGLDPVGHYTPCVEHNGVLYISGLVPTDPYTGELYSLDFKEQFEGVLRNLKLLLESSDSSLENLLKVNIYVSDSKNWTEVNDIYKDFMKENRPARIVLPVGEFRNNYLVEIDAIAKK